MCIIVEKRRDYISWRVAEDEEKNCKINLWELNKGMESQESIRQSRDWDAR